MITFSKDMYSLIQQSTRTRSTGTKPFKGNLEQDRLVWKGGGDRALFLVAAKQENGRGHCARGRRGLVGTAFYGRPLTGRLSNVCVRHRQVACLAKCLDERSRR